MEGHAPAAGHENFLQFGWADLESRGIAAVFQVPFVKLMELVTY